MQNDIKGTTPLKLALAWGFVGIPLLWGVSQTLLNSLKLFQWRRLPSAKHGESLAVLFHCWDWAGLAAGLRLASTAIPFGGPRAELVPPLGLSSPAKMGGSK